MFVYSSELFIWLMDYTIKKIKVSKRECLERHNSIGYVGRYGCLAIIEHK